MEGACENLMDDFLNPSEIGELDANFKAGLVFSCCFNGVATSECCLLRVGEEDPRAKIGFPVSLISSSICEMSCNTFFLTFSRLWIIRLLPSCASSSYCH